MGNCINRPACQPPAENISEISSPGSMPDAEPWVFPGSYAVNQLDSPVDWELLRSKTRPKKEQSEVSRFLDVSRHKNTRLSGEEGTDRSTALPMLRSTSDDAALEQTRLDASRSNSQ